MQMIQTIRKISGSKIKTVSSIFAAPFCSNKDSGKNPFPQNPFELPDKQPTYDHKINYNFEQNANYTKLRKEAEALKVKEDSIELKVKAREILPRRRRRIYDRPKHDLNLQNYGCWRVFDREMYKLHPFAHQVVCKIPLVPKQVKKAFGEPQPAIPTPHSVGQYNFEDSNLDLFILHDYASTTKYWGANLPGYDYENQDNIPPRKRISRWPTPEEFWASDEEFLFRVNCTPYADFRKFKQWVIQKVEEAQNGESKEDALQKTFGKFETFDDYNKKYELKSNAAVYKYDQSFFLEKGEKLQKSTRYHEKLTPSKKLDDKYLMTEEQRLASSKNVV